MYKLVSSCWSLDISYPHRIAGYSELGSTKVVLNDGKLSGGVIQDGSFVMCVYSRLFT